MAEMIWVGFGGALGAVLRYGISLLPYRGTFPILTFVTNVLGALFIGFVAGMAVGRGIPRNFVLFFKTGVCGGFTTFSTFSLEAYTLLEKGKVVEAFVYMGASMIFSLAGVLVGMYAGKRL